MAKNKLTDLQKKKIIADYIENQNYSKTAKMNGVHLESVRRIVKANKDFARKSEQKKEQDTQDILQYMDSIKDRQKRIIDLSLSALEDKLKTPDMFTNVKDIATVYGVIFDKALKYKEIKLRNQEDNNTLIKVEKLLGKIEEEADK